MHLMKTLLNIQYYAHYIILIFYIIQKKKCKLMSLENIYNFTHNTPKKFEKDNPKILLTVFNEYEKRIY